MAETLLIELLTEELPPKSLQKLALAFADALTSDLRQDGFLGAGSATVAFATPRRLAALITEVAPQAPDRENVIKGPSIRAGLDVDGKPTPALAGFANKRGVPVEALVRINDGKQEVFAHRDLAKGGHLDTNLDLKVEAALKRLPIPKVMRWGASEVQFVRPVHGLVMQHGRRAIDGEVLGLKSRDFTLGHRFLSQGKLEIPAADQYEAVLELQGCVIASFARRKEHIRAALEGVAGGADVMWDDALLDEVTALVEYPTVYQGTFSPEFLSVPQECLILSMKQHQKYFPLCGSGGKLLPKFLIVANLRADDPAGIILGNERVLRARLADAKFFYDQDRKIRLADRVPKLAHVVYHTNLGSQLDRVERIKLLAQTIARDLQTFEQRAARAAQLAKADLLTQMVGEFPELQGVMGHYYALQDGEDPDVAKAIEEHYRPRFARDSLPETSEGTCVALADKLETLIGFFGIGQGPTGEKDPFGLRRAALGVLRILAEKSLPLDLRQLLDDTRNLFAGRVEPDAPAKAYDFILERLRGYLRERGYAVDEIEAVISQESARIDLVMPRLDAVRAFRLLPEAESLAAANKRIRNILKKAPPADPSSIRAVQWESGEEAALFNLLNQLSPVIADYFGRQAYTEALLELVKFRRPVDNFFDKVMVMADDPGVRNSRLGLLRTLDGLMNQVADISKLAA